MKVVLRQWAKSPKSCVEYVVSTILMVVYTAVNAWIVTLIAKAMEDPANMVYHLGVLVGACAFQTVIGPFCGYLRKHATQYAFSAMSNDWFTKVIDADFEMFTKYSCSKIYTVGEFLWRCTAVAQSINQLISCAVTVIVTLSAIYLIGGKVVIPIIVIYFVGAILFRYLFKVYGKIDKELADTLKKRNQEHENVINGFAELRSFGMQDYHREKIIRLNNAIRDGKLKRVSINTVINIAFEVIDTIGLVVIMVYAVSQIANAGMNPATAMSLVLYVFRIINPLAGILDFIDGLSENLSLASDFDKISNYVNKIYVEGDSDKIEMDTFEDCIELRDVSFSYEKSSQVLRNINLKIKKGERVALVGESGKGKSTLAKLVLHFYEPDSGEITMDGIKLPDIQDKSFRRVVGSIQQENNIFPGTIWDNVTYGCPGALQADVVEACKKAQIYDFICGLEKKFETEVGPRGLKLSGGQKQRIAWARIFLADPEFIVLDEATSALDNETESLIQEIINAMKGKTMLIIAHRLSTIRGSDRIHVVGSEGIIQSGTHEELMAQGGAYAALQK